LALSNYHVLSTLIISSYLTVMASSFSSHKNSPASHLSAPTPGFLNGIPKGTVRHRFTNISDLRAALRRQCDLLAKGESYNQYLVFLNVTEKELEKLVENQIKSCRISYERNSGTLVVKILGKPHEAANRSFAGLLTNKAIQMGLFESLQPYGGSTIDLDISFKEGDSAWAPSPPPQGNPWPSVVLEVGYSESQARLVNDAKLWLEAPGSQVRTVITMKINRQPRRIVMQRWEMVQVARRVTRAAPTGQIIAARKIQEVRISLQPNNTTTVSGTFTLPFQNVFLRPQNPANVLEQDFTFTQQDLRAIANLVWRVM
jgi:hypothetical protein